MAMPDVADAPLPRARGPLSETVLDVLATPPESGAASAALEAALTATPWEAVDPYGDDLQLALYLCYELHYAGLAGVDPAWEWDPALLRLRARMERAYLDALRADTGEIDGPAARDVLAAELDALLVEPVDGEGVSHYLRDEGTRREMREYVVHRSVYHLKEADPHSLLIPRLRGRAKAALVAVEFDEYGGGRAEAMHSRLFADLMEGLDLDPGYGRYLDAVPAPALAVVTMMSLFGVHRARRGAMVGHFAAAEITTAPSAARIARAMRRLGEQERCARFFTEHIEADAVHEQVLRREVIGDLLRQEPDLAADVVFGIRATNLLEEHLGEHLLSSWRAGRTSLRRPLPADGASLP
ncbi:iron-containing redox enzyme family protein [Actinomadura logoneensis]|uniref:Iron-containing redox enzyme family protein n=2 Tax=Actinomadura logoneensis TaxID=2293572 RepID=A0A372JG60_9ACTN|nr:iron-containing redox enzyme family protein [Actinomadura logoneensis]